MKVEGGSSSAGIKGHISGKMGRVAAKVSGSSCLVNCSGKEDHPQDQAINTGTENGLNDEPCCK